MKKILLCVLIVSVCFDPKVSLYGMSEEEALKLEDSINAPMSQENFDIIIGQNKDCTVATIINMININNFKALELLKKLKSLHIFLLGKTTQDNIVLPDFSQFKNLEDLTIAGKDLELNKEIFTQLNNLGSLKRISIVGSLFKITQEEDKMPCIALMTKVKGDIICDFLAIINLKDRNLRQDQLCKLLKWRLPNDYTKARITEINISGNQIDSLDFIKDLPNLTKIDASNNKITDLGWLLTNYLHRDI